MAKIKKIVGRQVFDSRGNPTVEAEVFLDNKVKATSIVPSGASTGAFEAYELRDGNNSLYRGLSVLNAISNVNIVISNTFSGRNPFEQNKIDQDLIELDGTNNKNKLGANAMLGFSMAVARSASLSLKIPLYQYLGGIRSNTLPVPMMNIINGGAHANNGLDFQECMIMPIGFSNFSDALRAGTEVFHNLKQILSDKGFSVAVGDEGGFAPDVNCLDDALVNISDAIEKSGYKLGEQIYIAIDAAASELFDGQNYVLKGENKKLNTDQLVKYWKNLCKKFPVVSIEDPFDENDWNGFKELTRNIGKDV